MARCHSSVVRVSWDLGGPHTGQFTRDRYLTRDRSGASDRSLTCDRFFEEAGSALIYRGVLGISSLVEGGLEGEVIRIVDNGCWGLWLKIRAN